MRGLWTGMAMTLTLALLPASAGADFGVTSIAGVYQGDNGVQVKVYKSSNGKYLGDAAQATTIKGCAVTSGHTLWIIDGNGGESAGTPHTVGDYVKNIHRGKCVLKFGPTSFFVRIANVADDKAVKVLFSNNGHSAQTGDKSGKYFRFDLPAKKGANHVKVTVKTFHGKTYTKKKTLYC